MKRLLIIDTTTNIVVNATVAWEPPEGCIAVEHTEAQIGWLYDPNTGAFNPPEVGDTQGL